MTEQVSETIYIDGQRHRLLTILELPDSEKRLVKVDKNEIEDPDSIFFSTSCWREYLGTWAIKDDHLYLLKIKGAMKLLGDEPLFAHWFAGKLRIPNNELIEYEHMGFGSTYQEEHFIDIEKGIVSGGQTELILKVLSTLELAQDFAKKYETDNNKNTYIERQPVGLETEEQFLVKTNTYHPTIDKIIARLNVTNDYNEWRQSEDINLIFELSSGIPITEIAKKHLRSTGAIRSRLKHLNYETQTSTPVRKRNQLDSHSSSPNWFDGNKLKALIASKDITKLDDVGILLQFLSCFSQDTKIGGHRFVCRADIRGFETINSELLEFYLEPYAIVITQHRDTTGQDIELPYYSCLDDLDKSDYNRSVYDYGEDNGEQQPSENCTYWCGTPDLEKIESSISIALDYYEYTPYNFDDPPIESTGTLHDCLSKLYKCYGNFKLFSDLDSLVIDFFRKQIMLIDSDHLELIDEFDEKNMFRRELVVSLSDLKLQTFAGQ